MNTYPESTDIDKLVKSANKILIIQADNPDGDSLASALALEEIFGDQHKEVHLYCAVDVPDYLKHIKGWDRVTNQIPRHFDLTFIVDTSAYVLLEKLSKSNDQSLVASKPAVILDHHAGVKCDIPFAKVVVNDALAVSTGEVIFKISRQLKWQMNLQAKAHIASSILSDSLGLSSEGTTALTYRIMAELIEEGVDRPALEEARRALTKMPETIFRYKARLIERTELLGNGRIAVVTVPDNEIADYSPLYNPAPLIQGDMLQTEGVLVAIVLKNYHDNRVTASIRCNYGQGIAGDLAQHFGGGGHSYAAGFKVINDRPFNEIKNECIEQAIVLLDASNRE